MNILRNICGQDVNKLHRQIHHTGQMDKKAEKLRDKQRYIQTVNIYLVKIPAGKKRSRCKIMEEIIEGYFSEKQSYILFM